MLFLFSEKTQVTERLLKLKKQELKDNRKYRTEKLEKFDKLVELMKK